MKEIERVVSECNHKVRAVASIKIEGLVTWTREKFFERAAKNIRVFFFGAKVKKNCACNKDKLKTFVTARQPARNRELFAADD